VSIANLNHKTTSNVFCTSCKPLHLDGFPKHIRAKGKLESFPVQGKYVARLLVLIQAIWLKVTHGMYVSKKLMFLVAFAKLQKLVNWAQVVFNNLHFRLRDLSTVVKPKKEDPGKETEFGATQVVIIPQHWFLVNLIFQQLEFEDEDEGEDNSSTKPNPNVKKKGPTTSF
jgi:hypothetical protein